MRAGDMARGTVFVVDPWGTRGMAVYDYCLCTELARLGLDVSLVTDDHYDVMGLEPAFKVRSLYKGVHRSSTRATKGISYIRSLGRLVHAVARHRPAAVHYQFLVFPPTDLLAIKLLKRLGSRVFLTVHDVFAIDNKSYHVALVTSAYEAADGLIVHSDCARQGLQSALNGKLRPERVHAVPHGNYDLLSADPVPKEEARRLLSIDPQDKVALFFGSMLPYKGLDVLVEAFRPVADAIPRARLLVAGQVRRGHEEFGALAARIDELGMSSRVTTDLRFIPEPEIARYFCASDVVALPYKKCYTSGIAHLAMSYGRPVVATAVGSIPELVRHGETGFLAPPGDVRGLAEALIRALTDDAGAERAGEAGKELMNREHSWPVCAARTLDAYRRAGARL